MNETAAKNEESFRYIKCTGPYRLVNSQTGETLETIPWEQIVRLFMGEAPIIRGIELRERRALMRKLIALKEGESAPVKESQWTVLLASARHPLNLQATVLDSPDSETFFNTIIEAPTEDFSKKGEAKTNSTSAHVSS